MQEDTAKISAGSALFHTYPTEHINSLKTLEANKILHQTNYERAMMNLDKKRERAFKSKDFTKWELKAEDVKRAKDLLNDKTAAYKGKFGVVNAYSHVLQRPRRDIRAQG